MRVDGSTIGRQGKSKLPRSPRKQRIGWRVCFHRNGSGDRAEHCQLRQYSNDGTTKGSNERKGENGEKEKKMENKRKEKAEKEGKKDGKQETTGNIRK